MILVGGENLMDMIQTGRQGANALFEAVPGGSPYNLAMAIGRQGQRIGYLTPISKDANGQHLAAHITASQVELLAGRVDAPTSLAMVALEDGVPTYAFYREGTAERQVSLSALSGHLDMDVSLFHIGCLRWQMAKMQMSGRDLRLPVKTGRYRYRLTRISEPHLLQTLIITAPVLTGFWHAQIFSS